MSSWDEIKDFYKVYGDGIYSRDIDFGNGMLDLIRVLQNDPDINQMSLGTAMNWLLVALPDYDLQSVHIQWLTTDTYEIFLTPEAINEKPNLTRISLNEAVPKVKACLQRLEEKKIGSE